MEDRHVLEVSGGMTLAAVFDGHNGDAAASFCSEQLCTALLSAWRAAPSPVEAASAAFRTSFVSLNERFLVENPHDDSGCTALAALLVNDTLLVANAGDCQCKLWRGDAIVPLSREHIAADPEERERVAQAGGTVSVTTDGKLRVGGVIQVTRCIGDRPLRKLGLSAEPEVCAIELCAEDKVLLLASDGLWDVMPDARLLHCLRNTAQSPDLLAKRLIFDAMERGTDDNVSVVVIMLRDA
uniref:PPM-type phosphatase domain-containing protein n=1 Tax=Coccolithus braarudii TaxID=221442 RepID=A0A7S0LVV4_9EUKA